MTRPDAQRLAKRFLFAFVIVAAAIGVASLIGGDDGSSSSTSGTSSPTTSAVATKALPTSTPEPTDAVASPPTPASQPGIGASSTSDASNPAARLGVPDLTEHCLDVTGVGSVAGPPVQWSYDCAGPDGSAVSVDITTVCMQDFGPQSRQVLIASAPDAVRCTSDQVRDAGQPDFDTYCKSRYGAPSEAALIANDNRGWRCVTIRHDIFERMEMDYDHHEVDAACQVTTGGEAFALSVDTTPDGWRCYEPA